MAWITISDSQNWVELVEKLEGLGSSVYLTTSEAL